MYQVYSISTKDNKFKYYGSTNNMTKRMYLHNYRFNGGKGGHYFVYKVLRTKVKSLDECKIEVLRNFHSKENALKMEQRLIEKDGNLNSVSAIGG